MKTMKSPLRDEIIKVIPLSFGELLCSKNYCISEVSDGFHIDEKELLELIEATKSFYNDRQFHYINNRVASFSVNPLCYKNFKLLENNIMSTRVVLYHHSQELTVQFERTFYPLDATFHRSLKYAVNDLNRIVMDH